MNTSIASPPPLTHPPSPSCRFIFRTFFECFEFERLIIIEDDMLLAPDFFSYFLATGKVMDRDPSLLCVSSWNDHGQVRGRSKGAGGLDESIELIASILVCPRSNNLSVMKRPCGGQTFSRASAGSQAATCGTRYEAAGEITARGGGTGSFCWVRNGATLPQGCLFARSYEQSSDSLTSCRPPAYWDDWLRLNSTRQGRQCLR